MGRLFTRRYGNTRTNMNLWVYGCSFSEPFGLEGRGPVFDEQGCRILAADFWGTHLASKLNLQCRAKSISGVGWNYISEAIDNDILKWQDDDIIIISPSFFARVTFEELIQRDSQTELAMQMKPWDFIHNYNKTRWQTKVKTLQHFGYNVYTWSVDPVEIDFVENLLVPNHETACWKDWMDQHYEYWTSLPGEIYPMGDWHFNPAGHLAVAEIMYQQICKKQQ